MRKDLILQYAIGNLLFHYSRHAQVKKRKRKKKSHCFRKSYRFDWGSWRVDKLPQFQISSLVQHWRVLPGCLLALPSTQPLHGKSPIATINLGNCTAIPAKFYYASFGSLGYDSGRIHGYFRQALRYFLAAYS